MALESGFKLLFVIRANGVYYLLSSGFYFSMYKSLAEGGTAK